MELFSKLRAGSSPCPKCKNNIVIDIQRPHEGRPGWKCRDIMSLLFSNKDLYPVTTHWADEDNNELGPVGL